MQASVDAWQAWFAGWYSAHWTPEDVSALRQVVRLHDEVERGDFRLHGELRLAMDTWGMTPKGQQDRRWVRPSEQQERVAPPPSSRERRLKAV